jgi:hypothetical protein
MSKGVEFFDGKSLIHVLHVLKENNIELSFWKKVPTSRATKILEIIPSDICGPFQTHIHTRWPYFITFIDDKHYNLFVET